MQYVGLLVCESESPNYFIDVWDLKFSPSAVTRVQVGGNGIIPASPSGGLRRLASVAVVVVIVVVVVVEVVISFGCRSVVAAAGMQGEESETVISAFFQYQAWLDSRWRKINTRYSSLLLRQGEEK